MVLCVDCMKCVGRSGASSRPFKAFRKDSEFSMQPKSVPMTTASGTAIPACFRASADVQTARFRSRPIRRASITENRLR